jgi:subtilisin family serine protease
VNGCRQNKTSKKDYPMKTRKWNGAMSTGFTSIAIVAARLLLVCATSAILAPGTSIAGSGQDPLYYHYFKERRPLKLETERVAILQARTAATEGPGQALSKFDLAPEATQVLPIAGWSLAGTPAASHTEAATRDLVSRMSGDSVFAFVAPVFAGDGGVPNIVTQDLLVGFEPSVTEQRAEAILTELNAGDIIQRHFGNMKGAYHLRTRLKNGFDVLDMANKLAERPEVRFAEPDMIFTGQSALIPNDPGFTNLWGMQNTEQFGGALGIDMKAPQAWDITTGSSNIIVVILDVGVQPDHPDINQIPGTNFTSDVSFDGGPVNACDNHGTTVAGCVSAIINNNLGTVGIAPGCRCASARAFIANNSCDNSFTSQSSWTVNALAWAQSIGARVSNNSNKYGLSLQSSAIAAEYMFTRGMGMVHFAAAGNDATNSIVYPASLPGVNAVAAVQEGGALTSGSNHGTGLAFSAPGLHIYTTDRTGTNGYGSGDYVFSDGTSLASPYAAGVAALVLSVNPSLNATNVEQIMQQSCVDLGPPGYDTTYGWGLVNAYNAVMLALAVPPATITVTSTADSGAGTLRAALASAANGDTIDASGVAGTILLTSGELLVSNNVTILGPGPANLAVDGNAASRAFNISGTAVTLAGLTITNGNASGGGFPANSGGGIYSGPGTLTVSNCAFSGNAAQYDGAGILANHSILTVSACSFSGNLASGNGGGIFINALRGAATLTVSNCTFSGNTASGDSGGAIYNNGQDSGNATEQIVNSTLSGNSAGYGAGIYNDGHSSGSATLTVSNCTLSNNLASGWGGGIFNGGSLSGTGTVEIVNSTLNGNSASNDSGGGIFNQGYNGNATVSVSASTLSDNSAGYGAGMYNNGYAGSATLTLKASTLSGNLASGAGAGIYNNGKSSGTGTVQIATSTLSGNLAAGDGGGIYNDGTSSGQATLTVKASTFSGNSAGGGNGGAIRNNGGGGIASVEIGSSILKTDASGGNIANLSGTVSSDGYNLTSDDGGGFLTSTADQINTDPMLGPLEDNGGPTFTHALLPGSAAIDKGKNFSGSAADQRGLPRTMDSPCIANASGGDGTDIGAFEVQQPCPLAVSLGNFGVVSSQFRFDIAGGSNQVVVVEASTNLVSWTALATNTLGAAPLRFIDPGWTNFQHRFYRVKLAP